MPPVSSAHRLERRVHRDARPHTLVGKLGIDLTDLSFWNEGLGAIEDLIAQAEGLAGTLRKDRGLKVDAAFHARRIGLKR